MMQELTARACFLAIVTTIALAAVCALQLSHEHKPEPTGIHSYCVVPEELKEWFGPWQHFVPCQMLPFERDA